MKVKTEKQNKKTTGRENRKTKKPRNKTETETPPYPTFLTILHKIKRTQNKTKANEVHVQNLFLCEVEEVAVAHVENPNNM